jgi:DNA topoisomerase-3
MSQGDKLKGEYQIKSKMTEPPKKYTDSSLLAAMVSAGRDLNDEELKKIMSTDVEGIGTVATRAAIVETLVTRGYAVRNKKNIMATDKGIALIQALPLPEIKSAELTARWERRLNMIAEGKDDFDSFVRDIEALTGEWCKKIYDSTSTVSISRNGSTGLKCPTCGKEIIKFSWGYGCSGYKTGCKFSVGNTVAGKKLTDKQLTDLISKGKTTKIKGLKRKTGEEFDAALKLENGKVKFVSESKYPKKTT